MLIAMHVKLILTFALMVKIGNVNHVIHITHKVTIMTQKIHII
jgi:hypothetical protein